MTRIAHISDIHFGRIAHPEIVDALIADINGSKVDLVVASGDLTQRAFGHQFRAARRMLDAFDAPALVVPGNHDVFPWWRLVSRLFDPLRRYKRLITSDLAPRWANGDVVVQGINSAFGWTIQGGRITDQELQHIKDGLGGTSSEALKVLVVHHHLNEVPGLGHHDLARGRGAAIDVAVRAGVNVILSGHLHVFAAECIQVSAKENSAKEVVVVSTGTATSNRWRSPDIGENSYAMLTIDQERVRVQKRLFDASKKKYAEDPKEWSFKRD